MSQVIVVGGGFAGMSVAVRLAKLGHAVTVFESSDRLGGQLLPRDGTIFSWDRHPATLTMPATLRDLFRKSGRPLDRVLDLHHLTPGRRHVFDDRSVIDLPLGQRGEQLLAVEMARPGHGEAWTAWIDGLGPSWEVLRRRALDRSFSGRKDIAWSQWRTLKPRPSADRFVNKSIKDEHLRAIVLDQIALAGHDPRATPALVTTQHFVERNFGRWVIDGGASALLDALTARLSERRVDLQLSTHVHDIVVRDASVAGVESDLGTIAADLVVWAAPVQPPSGPKTPLLPIIPPARTYLGVDTEAPALPTETVVHANPPMRITTAPHPPQGSAWTIEHRNTGGEDVLITLARHGIDVRSHVLERLDLSPVDLVRETRDGASGWRWATWRSAMHLPGVGQPVAGLFTVGVNAHPGPTMELIAMGTAAAATTIGKA